MSRTFLHTLRLYFDLVFLYLRSYTVRSRKLWNRKKTNTAMVKCILCSYKTNSISITKVKWVSLLCKVAVTHAH